MTFKGTDASPCVKVPKFHGCVTGCGDEERFADLDGVDGTFVAFETAEEGEGLAVIDADGHVAGAGDDVGVGEADVEDAHGVI